MKKRLLIVLLAIIMCFILTGCGKEKTNNGENSNQGEKQQQDINNKDTIVSKVGETLGFGTKENKNIEWQVLEIDNDTKKALIVTKNCIRLDVFNEIDTAVWANSTIRTWLNEEFVKQFGSSETTRILTTELNSNENLNFNDYPEEKITWQTTNDKVFLLSADEVKRYFADDESRKAILSLSDNEMLATYDRYLKNFNYVDDDGMVKKDMYDLNNHVVDYWLRSNGRGYMSQTVSEYGSIDDYGANQDATFKGIRPAMWIDISIENK